MQRLTVEHYCREALAILGEQGSEALTIAVLCEGLDVTKGSFYHHFGSMAGFVANLLAFWEREHSDRLIAMSRAQPDPTLRITTITEIGVNLPHAPESAIRAWGRSNPIVAQAVARVDRRRERHLFESISALGTRHRPSPRAYPHSCRAESARRADPRAPGRPHTGPADVRGGQQADLPRGRSGSRGPGHRLRVGRSGCELSAKTSVMAVTQASPSSHAPVTSLR